MRSALAFTAGLLAAVLAGHIVVRRETPEARLIREEFTRPC